MKEELWDWGGERVEERKRKSVCERGGTWWRVVSLSVNELHDLQTWTRRNYLVDYCNGLIFHFADDLAGTY